MNNINGKKQTKNKHLADAENKLMLPDGGRGRVGDRDERDDEVPRAG